MQDHLNRLAGDLEIIGEYRGRGVLWGVELVTDRRSRIPANRAAEAAVKACEDMGLLVQSRGSHQRKNVIRLVPPLVCVQVPTLVHLARLLLFELRQAADSII